jgi:hypothetical protein
LSLLFDAADAAGVRSLAQTRLGTRPTVDVALPDLSEAAYATLVSVIARSCGDFDELAAGPLFLPLNRRFESRRIAVEERPPLDSF